jgi:ABC-type Zn uptake system ZnuABC Zn-binding protein ZnuA
MRPLRTARLLLPLLLATAATNACGSDDTTTASGEGGLVVATTVSPLTNVVANIAGDEVTVIGLVPEGTNSHTFEPPPSAAKTLAQADVVFVNGLELESVIADLAEGDRKEGAETVELGDAILPESEFIYDFSFPKDGGKPNPHLWTSPRRVIQYAEIVEATLSRRDPDNREYFKANLKRYIAKVRAFEGALIEATGTIRADNRKLLTYHDAYAYFARDYDWQVIGAIQPSDFEEPTAAEVADLITQIKAEKVPVVFGSEVFPSPVLQRIAEETGAAYIDDLRDDDLPGAPGEKDHTLLALLRFNFSTMIEALGGDPGALADVDVADVVTDRAEYPQ